MRFQNDPLELHLCTVVPNNKVKSTCIGCVDNLCSDVLKVVCFTCCFIFADHSLAFRGIVPEKHLGMGKCQNIGALKFAQCFQL